MPVCVCVCDDDEDDDDDDDDDVFYLFLQKKNQPTIKKKSAQRYIPQGYFPP